MIFFSCFTCAGAFKEHSFADPSEGSHIAWCLFPILWCGIGWLRKGAHCVFAILCGLSCLFCFICSVSIASQIAVSDILLSSFAFSFHVVTHCGISATQFAPHVLHPDFAWLLLSLTGTVLCEFAFGLACATLRQQDNDTCQICAGISKEHGRANVNDGTQFSWCPLPISLYGIDWLMQRAYSIFAVLCGLSCLFCFICSISIVSQTSVCEILFSSFDFSYHVATCCDKLATHFALHVLHPGFAWLWLCLIGFVLCEITFGFAIAALRQHDDHSFCSIQALTLVGHSDVERIFKGKEIRGVGSPRFRVEGNPLIPVQKDMRSAWASCATVAAPWLKI